MKNKFSLKQVVTAVAVLIFVFMTGYWSSGEPMPSAQQENFTATEWTCSMHPQIRQPNPGSCPLCGMDLIPATSSRAEAGGPTQITLSERARALAGVMTQPVQRKFVHKEIRIVGKITFDETRVHYITAWVPGRIERMFVDYTGTPVRKGEHLVDLYSPELLTAQQELIRLSDAAAGGADQIFEQNLRAARERLRLWGLTGQQVADIISQRKASEVVTIYSPIGGVVMERQGYPGMYLTTGSRIFTIADLSSVWLKLDAYETDLPWLRYGQEVKFSIESAPGESFSGRIIFIDPVLDEQTRTVKVRVNVANYAGKLKPGMFVRATVSADIAAGGKVMAADLAGKWICPMHPEIVKKNKGTCDVCGMALVRPESLGYVVPDAAQQEASLVIPASAVLLTGTRALVYVELPTQPGLYEGREITVGERAGDYYIVVDGLSEGEKVVVNGNFKIDSAIQLRGGVSMMNPPAGKTVVETKSNVPLPGVVPQKIMEQFDQVLERYFTVHHALSLDSLDTAQMAANDLQKAVTAVEVKLLNPPMYAKWLEIEPGIVSAARQIASSANITEARVVFNQLSSAMAGAARIFGSARFSVFVYHCPMAFDGEGADWLQDTEGTANPYYGSSMFKCGSQTEIIVRN